MPVLSVGRRIAADIALWYFLPCAFLLAYVSVLHQPPSAVLPHLAAMALPLALLCMVRLVFSLLIPHRALQLALSAITLGMLIVAMLTYYTLVLISVGYWGGVVSWLAIPTFFRQAPDIVDAIGVPRLLASAGALALLSFVLAACAFYLQRCDWTIVLQRSARIKAICVSAGFCALWIQVATVTAAPWINQAEPLSMTLFPLASARNVEGHHVSAASAERMDELDERARAAYKPADATQVSKPNIILIVVDAMRPDHMSLFGYQRKTTPYLDGLASSRSVRKVVAHAACSDTVCGLLSLTSSKLPQDFSFHPFGIHQVLRRNGYRVHMILAGDHSYFHNMKTYYGEVDSWFDGNSVSSTSIDDDQALVEHLATMADADSAPTMFQFHLMSAHVTRRDDGRRVFSPANSYLLAPSIDNDGHDTVLPSATNYYDNGILGADRVIGTLLGQLQQKGYLRRALVIITADHGEALGEHGIFMHANSVREEVLKVPLVFIAYGYEPADSIATATFPLQIDIAPTILAELKIPAPRTWEGRPLQRESEASITYFEERDYVGLIDRRKPDSLWKYWLDRNRGGEFAFDLTVDPRETRNLIDSVPASLRSEWRGRVVYSRN